MADQEPDDLLTRLSEAAEKRLEANEERKAERKSFMVGRYIYHKRQRYEVTQWGQTAEGQVQVSTNPPDADLTELLRRLIVNKMPLLYYHHVDCYYILDPNLPTPITTARSP